MDNFQSSKDCVSDSLTHRVYGYFLWMNPRDGMTEESFVTAIHCSHVQYYLICSQCLASWTLFVRTLLQNT